MAERIHATVSVLIVDDDPDVRAMLAAYLCENESLELAGSAEDAESGVEVAARTQPDVALVDFHMPGGGTRAVRGILEHSPHTRIVALSGHADRQNAFDMLRAGAASYVVKTASPDEIAATLLRAARGESVLAAEVAEDVIGELAAHLERRQLAAGEAARMREAVEHAIRAGKIRPVFQPIVDLASNATVGVEALSRFDCDPPQTPDRWFAAADAVGLRAELELYAAERAVAQFRERGGCPFLSLNASPDTLAWYGNLAAELGDQLVIEITEHAAIDDYDKVTSHFEILRGLGVRLAVDDAGAGFASLRHVLQLAPDFVKLDVSLTRGIDVDRRRRALAHGLTGFAHELGATIVAEGIETQAELDTLRALGVALGQGHFLATPAPL